MSNQYPNWREYEDLVFEVLSLENSDLEFSRNVTLPGLVSGTNRQIDILATGNIAGHEIVVVIDCKHHTLPLDVNDVGMFSSLLDDVSADIGILVAETGFSSAATQLAERNRIKLEIRNLDELRSFHILDLCDICDPGEDRFPGVIDWHYPNSVCLDEAQVKAVGWCDWCNCIHMKCASCSQVTGIPEPQYGSWVECVGGCSSRYRVVYGEPGRPEVIEVDL